MYLQAGMLAVNEDRMFAISANEDGECSRIAGMLFMNEDRMFVYCLLLSCIFAAV